MFALLGFFVMFLASSPSPAADPVGFWPDSSRLRMTTDQPGDFDTRVDPK